MTVTDLCTLVIALALQNAQLHTVNARLNTEIAELRATFTARVNELSNAMHRHAGALVACLKETRLASCRSEPDAIGTSRR